MDQVRYRKRAIPLAVRRDVALKYACEPGRHAQAECHYCGRTGGIYWHQVRSGRPSSWVTFDHELDHVVPERLGGPSTVDNIVLACRSCNRRKWMKQ